MRLHGYRLRAMSCLGGARSGRAPRHRCVVDGVELRPRSARAPASPRAGGDVFDRALAGPGGRASRRIVQDLEGNVQLAVMRGRRPGARPRRAAPAGAPLLLRARRGRAAAGAAARRRVRILVAGIGNVFLGDDGFGVALAAAARRRELAARASRSSTSASAAWTSPTRCSELRRRRPARRHAARRGAGDAVRDRAGARTALDVALDAHGMDPVKVLALARALGGVPPRTLVRRLRAADALDRRRRGDRRRAQRARAGGAGRSRAAARASYWTS